MAGNTTSYRYDETGTLAEARQTSSAGEELARVDYSYDEFGRTTTLDRSNGVLTRYTFTPTNEIETETTTDASDAIIANAAYSYDTHGNVSTRVDARREQNGLVTESRAYRYNAFDQLIETRVYPGDREAMQGEPSELTRYDIGVSGEVSRESVTRSGVTTTRAFEYNELGETTSVVTTPESSVGLRAEQQYDAAGNLTQGVDGTTYRYDVHNRPVAQTNPDGSAAAYDYWANGQRRTISSCDATGQTHETTGLYWDGSTIVNDTHERQGMAETRAVTVESYLFGLSRNARTTSISEETRFYVADRHGNTSVVTEHDGAVSETYSYDDYGTPQRHTGFDREENATEQFLFSGEYTMRDGKQLLGKRVYDPKTRAFTTKDDADQFNLYSYAHSNPVNLADPSGQTPISDDAINGIFIGAMVVAASITAVFTPWTQWGMSAFANMGILVGGIGILADASAAAIATGHILAKGQGVGQDTLDKLGWAELGLGVAAIATTVASPVFRYGHVRSVSHAPANVAPPAASQAVPNEGFLAKSHLREVTNAASNLKRDLRYAEEDTMNWRWVQNDPGAIHQTASESAARYEKALATVATAYKTSGATYRGAMDGVKDSLIQDVGAIDVVARRAKKGVETAQGEAAKALRTAQDNPNEFQNPVGQNIGHAQQKVAQLGTALPFATATERSLASASKHAQDLILAT